MRMPSCGAGARAVTLALVVCAIAPGTGLGAESSRDSVRTVVAGEQYRAGSLHRFLLGSDYRDLWSVPIKVGELDMHTFAGGLQPIRRVGGQQTRGLALKGADGRDYTFRSLDKDPSEILPPEFQNTFVDRLLQDQIASSFPGAGIAVAPLMEAAGVLHADPILVVMPDDSLLGEFRPVFAGLLGTLEEYPQAAGNGNPGFAGASEIINGEEMWKRMDEDPSTRPDARAFLAARLVDVLVGDWDRHRGQWRWALVPGHERWQPIPEDRDQAFVRFEGVIPALGRHRFPQFVSFDEDYPAVEGLTWNGRDGDRRILVDLERAEWEQVASELKSNITDEAIAEAVARIPEEYRNLEGSELESVLRSRRDRLPEIAERFYRFLARDVDIRATNDAELVTVIHEENGDVEISVADLGEPDGAPYYRRVFHAGETEEVRLYLAGGHDSVTTVGTKGRVTVRALGGDGDDSFDDSAGTGLRVSDASGENVVRAGRGTKLDTRPYTAPERRKAQWIPPRDWGRRNLVYPWVGGNSDLGWLFLLGLRSEGYGFRKDPYADRHDLRIGYATQAGALGADYRGEFPFENSSSRAALYLRASGLDFLHFYGFGNETEAPADEDFYKVKHTEYVLEPSLETRVGRAWTATLLVAGKYSKTDLDEDRYIATAPPYGSEEFVQAGAGSKLELDTRDSDVLATRGVHLRLAGTVFPPIGKVESTFGEIHGDASCYLTIPVASDPVLALRAGGKQVWGAYPYHEAAYVGGMGTVRGFAQQRYAGDASAYANAELRIPLARIYIFVPGSMGVFGLGDVGRVFLDSESSRKWHTSVGGGLWFCFLYPENTVSFSVATSEEDTRIYLRAGLTF